MTSSGKRGGNHLIDVERNYHMRAVFRNYQNDADERLDTPTPNVFGANGTTWYRVSVAFDAREVDAEDLIDLATEAKYQMDETEAAAIRREARMYHYQAF